MPKVRIVLEFEVSEAPIDQALADATWGRPSAGENYAADLALEKILAKVLEANPALQRQAVLNYVLGGLIFQVRDLEIKGLTVDEALEHSYHSLIPLLLSQVPEENREAVQQYCQESGLLDEKPSVAALVEERFSYELLRVVVEDEQGTLANTDERKRKYKKKRR